MNGFRCFLAVALWMTVHPSCASNGPTPDGRSYSIRELLPLREGNQWVLDVLAPDSTGDSTGKCRLSVASIPGTDLVFELQGRRESQAQQSGQESGAEKRNPGTTEEEGTSSTFSGRLERRDRELRLSFGGLPLTILQEPVYEGQTWSFVSEAKKGEPSISGKAVVSFGAWDGVELGPTSGGSLDSPGTPKTIGGTASPVVVEVRLTLRAGRKVSYEGYSFLPGIGFAEIRRSDDGKTWSRMKLREWSLRSSDNRP